MGAREGSVKTTYTMGRGERKNEIMCRKEGECTHHLKTMPADGTLIRARGEPVRNAIVAKGVAAAADGVRVDKDIGANHASQLVVEPLRQAGSRCARFF